MPKCSHSGAHSGAHSCAHCCEHSCADPCAHPILVHILVHNAHTFADTVHIHFKLYSKKRNGQNNLISSNNQ